MGFLETFRKGSCPTWVKIFLTRAAGAGVVHRTTTVRVEQLRVGTLAPGVAAARAVAHARERMAQRHAVKERVWGAAVLAEAEKHVGAAGIRSLVRIPPSVHRAAYKVGDYAAARCLARRGS